jgi:hypothetical protein
MTDPLVVNDEIELPQLDISNNYTMDCTIPYSTGDILTDDCVNVCLTLLITSFTLFSCRKFHVSRGRFQSEATFRLPLIPHLHTISFDCCHVVDFVLDQT